MGLQRRGVERSTSDAGVAPSSIKPASGGTRVFAGVLSVAGVGALLWLIVKTGPTLLLASLAQVSASLPYVLALEAARTLAELWSMYALLGRHTAALPASRLLRAQLLCSGLSHIMPAGRALGESARAAMLGAVLPMPVAAAIGALGQVLTLVVNGSVGLAGGALAWRLGHVRFAGACFVYGTALLTAGFALLVGLRSRTLAAALSRSRLTAPWSEPVLQAGQAVAVGAAGLGRAFAAQALGRVMQCAQLALLALALGHHHAWADAPILQAIYMLGAAAGDLIPAQLGALDAAFALAQPLLNMQPSAALALGLAMHAVQLSAAALCFAGLCVPAPARRRALTGASSEPKLRELA